MLFWQMIKDGGPVMWVILGLAAVALLIFLQKTFQFHRDEINVRELVKGLVNVLKRNGYVEALTLCDSTPGPAARVLGAAILARERGDEDLRAAIDDACLEEIPRLERLLPVLSTVGFIAPLLGLLGTVIGMMQTFQILHQTQTAYLSASQLSGSVNLALLTTAAGLVVAIPCYAAYNYLLSRMNAILLDMEKASSEILTFFERSRRRGTADPDADAEPGTGEVADAAERE